MTSRLLISVVDDDEAVRDALPDLLQEFGFSVRVFSSGAEFLQSRWVALTRCLIADIAMPHMTGPELYDEIKRRKINIPVIFITAHASEKVMPLIQHLGPVGCLFKPFSDAALRAAIVAALNFE